jgi:effector-binding domain-containing protein
MLRVSTVIQARPILWAAVLVATLVAHSALAQTKEPTDATGEEVMLQGKPMVFIAGKATWTNAFQTLAGQFKTISAFLGKQKIKPAGPAMTIYIGANDYGFEYHAAMPLAEAPTNLPRGTVTVGQTPVGKAYKFVYRGSYDAMDHFYEQVRNFLDEKRLERAGTYYEEYVSDPITTPADKLVVNVFVLVK